ncbi:MAG TPA: hypothetical protein VIF88_14240 [Methylocystis sp.]|jgi:hypothetical protein
MSYISSEYPVVAQIGVAVVVAFLWFVATCFFSGVVIGLLQVISFVRTPRHLRASRFPDLSKFHE